jgi:protein TonB
VVVQPVAVPEKPPEAVPDNAMEGLEGVEGGVEGGVPGGVAGGIEGGVVGGVEGGVPGPAEEILRVGGDVTKPELIRSVQPVYPEIARRARISGVVIVEAIIDQTGTVTNARILKSLPMGLAEAAVEAVKQWKYKPATLNGRPVSVYFTLTVNFKLQ